MRQRRRGRAARGGLARLARPRGDEAAAKAARYLARAGRWSDLLAGAVLGVADRLAEVGCRLSVAVAGAAELQAALGRRSRRVFSLVLMIGWWLWLPGRAGGRRGGEWRAACWPCWPRRTAVSLSAAVFGGGPADDAGQTSGERIRGAEFRQLMVVGETPALAVHVALASVAVAASCCSGSRCAGGDAATRPAAREIAVLGRPLGAGAVAGCSFRSACGRWPRCRRRRSRRSWATSTIGTLLFVGSLAAALWLISELVNVALGETTRPR